MRVGWKRIRILRRNTSRGRKGLRRRSLRLHSRISRGRGRDCSRKGIIMTPWIRITVPWTRLCWIFRQRASTPTNRSSEGWKISKTEGNWSLNCWVRANNVSCSTTIRQKPSPRPNDHPFSEHHITSIKSRLMITQTPVRLFKIWESDEEGWLRSPCKITDHWR